MAGWLPLDTWIVVIGVLSSCVTAATKFCMRCACSSSRLMFR